MINSLLSLGKGMPIFYLSLVGPNGIDEKPGILCPDRELCGSPKATMCYPDQLHSCQHINRKCEMLKLLDLPKLFRHFNNYTPALLYL